MSMVIFEQVSKRYDSGKEALSGVSFELKKANCPFNRPQRRRQKHDDETDYADGTPSRGQVHVDGQNLNRLPSDMIPYHRRKVGVVFQNHQLYSTVASLITSPCLF